MVGDIRVDEEGERKEAEGGAAERKSTETGAGLSAVVARRVAGGGKQSGQGDWPVCGVSRNFVNGEKPTPALN